MMMVIGGPSKGGEDDKPSYGKGDDEKEEGEESPGLSGMARKRAAKDVLRAIESQDAGALDEALAAHYEACSDE